MAEVRVPLNYFQTLSAAEFPSRSQVDPLHDQPPGERMPLNVRRNVRQFSMPAGGFKGCSEAL